MPTPQTPQASTPAAATPAPTATLSQQTAALAKEIASESASGADWSESPDASAAPRESIADVNARKATPAATVADDDPDDDPDEPAGASASASVDPALAELIKSRDLDALAAHLGIENAEEFFRIGAADFKALRHERKKIAGDVKGLETLRTELQEKYGEPIVARKQFQAGDLNAFFATVEKWSGVPYADVQKAWVLHVQGKPVPKLEPKPQADPAVTVDAQKVAQLKERITGDIAKDPLAGVPGVVDLVFEKMRTKWNEGVRTPQAALKLVAADLAERNKAERVALRKAGVIKGKEREPERRPASVPSPRQGSATTQATSGKPGTSRPMTDRELAREVLQGLGKEAWRQ